MSRTLAQRPEGFTLNPTAGLARGLVFAGLGRFHGSTRYHDSSLCRNTGTLTGFSGAGDTPLDKWRWIPQLGRWGLGFDHSNDYVITPVVNHGFGTGNFTIAAWVNMAAAGGIVGIWGNSASSLPAFYADVSGTIRDWTDGGWGIYSGTVTAAVWTHLVFLRRSGVLYVYKDGVQDATTKAYTTSISNATWAWGSSGTASEYFNGLLSDCMGWARALSAAEIAALADPSNVMLSGLILPPTRRLIAVGAGGAPSAGPSIAVLAAATQRHKPIGVFQ